MSNGKGSKRRPASVGQDTFGENWDRTFTNPDPRQLALPLAHVWYKCECYQTGCQFCDGGLGYCTVCGGAEGSLLPECPGRKLSYEEHEQNYRDNLARWAREAEEARETTTR